MRDHALHRVGFRVALLVVSTVVLVLCVSSAAGDSATDDEPAHIVSGCLKVCCGALDFYPGQPPLAHVAVAAPLLFTGSSVNPDWRFDPNHWEVGRAFLYAPGNDAGRLLLLARAPAMLCFLALCLTVCGFVLETTGSRGAALAALLLAAFCPNLTAHGRLATSDMGAAFFCFLTAVAFIRFLRGPSAARAVGAGIALSCALLTKVSCVILLPYLALVLAAFATMERQVFFARARALRAGCLLLAATTFVAVEGFYFALADSEFLRRAYPSLGDGLLTRLALPVLEYMRNFGSIRAYVAGAHEIPQFLLGSFSSQGWWSYYPIAFALKTPLSTLLLVAAAGAVFVWTWVPRSRLHEEGRHSLFEATALAGFVALFLGTAMTTHLDLGVRYILPIYPFLYATIGLCLHTALRASRERARLVAAAVGALLLFSVTAGLRAYPGYIGYFNELVPRGAEDRLLVDSNLDWGQDLKRLARFVGENHIETIRVMYFGGGDVAYELGDRGIPWEPSRTREKGLYAVSRHLYRMSTRDPGQLIDLERYFAGARLQAIVGTSIYVFQSD